VDGFSENARVMIMMETALLSELILQEDWLKPEKETAWQDL
jgi:hypothetical protein